MPGDPPNKVPLNAMRASDHPPTVNPSVDGVKTFALSVPVEVCMELIEKWKRRANGAPANEGDCSIQCANELRDAVKALLE